jgi:CDP-diacylglycerol--glycerol-3-phosphate 3-phosphatidyltransferase
VIVSALYFFPNGELFLGTLIVTIFVLSDLFDGTLARLANQSGTKWGALLDSTLDRAADAAICLGIWWFLNKAEDPSQMLALAALFFSALIPYIRAKAESLGIECSVGMAERPERLIILLTGTGLTGLGVTGALSISLWLLLVLSLITVAQRMLIVYRGK